MKTKLILIFALCVCSGYVSAQTKPASNYVVTTTNDTIKCELKGTRKYMPLNSTDKKFIKITPDKISDIFNAKDSITYSAVSKPNALDSTYLQRHEHGKLNLYEEENTSYSGGGMYGGVGTFNSTTKWYISKNNAPIVQLKSNTIFNNGSQGKRKNIFMEMIADDPALLEEFKKTDSFSFKVLRDFVHRYNIDMAGK
ncbi:hypothetical protein IDJ77_21185 [Mucilaginibacter sp. ZT4R22]|uniref:GLPGLI family protein n=1 Tax=Mucilaginibacter pankratovii TaxID=2772110 RepID=A0ABR7WVM0_9SPHI|nr:hypothetical protein [Mucilaginibacter pankratovii]MBD1366341.1 hypothetical protein [Mucilaginibacter pankratovii]